MGQVIQIDEARIRDHLGEMVRGTVEEILNAMLDAEADLLCGAGRYERGETRQDTRAGNYERTLHTKAGDVSLKIPKLRRQTFETAIISRRMRSKNYIICPNPPPVLLPEGIVGERLLDCRFGKLGRLCQPQAAQLHPQGLDQIGQIEL